MRSENLAQLKSKFKFAFKSLHYPLYFYQQLVDENDVFYGKEKSLKISGKISVPPILQIFKCISFLTIIRSCVVIFIRLYKIPHETVRSYVGPDLMKEDGLFMESTFVIWHCIIVLFIHYTLSNKSLSDYSFLSLLRMSEQNYHRFGISNKEFVQFQRNRDFAFKIYQSLIFFVYLSFAIGTILYNVYFSLIDLTLTERIVYPFICYVWFFLINSILYSNLFIFILTMSYIHIKQNAIAIKIANNCQLFIQNGHKLCQILIMESIDRHCKLQRELQTYEHFWSSFISFIFFFYILLINLIMMIFIYAKMTIFVNIVYCSTFVYHIIFIWLVVYYCAEIVRRNKHLRNALYFYAGKMTKRGHLFSRREFQRKVGSFLYPRINIKI